MDSFLLEVALGRGGMNGVWMDPPELASGLEIIRRINI